jgi:16S rRNA G966 N2-methylase RsmD
MKKRFNNKITIIINDFYNFYFKFFSNIKIDLFRPIVKNKDIANLEHATHLQTVWLLNLKRLYNLFKKEYNSSKYHFIDVGCGNGIPIIYSYKKLKFKTNMGFDHNNRYVKISKQNVVSSIGNKNNINIFKDDASSHLLNTHKKYFIFMYNPFNAHILNNFIKNNLKSLKKNSSVIAYSNLDEVSKIKVLKKYSNGFINVDKYKIYLFKF